MSICLSMIVKNEAACIGRCLTAVKPWIDRWAIVDTGSSDDTVRLIEGHLADLPGGVTHRAFTDFADSRNHALSVARETDCDHVLMLDADMELVVEDNEWRKAVVPDVSYTLTLQHGGLAYRQPRLTHRASDALYVGSTHEYLDIAGAKPIDGVALVEHADGGTRPEKFARDIRLLHRDLQRDPDNPRTVFYLAQSYRDTGCFVDARDMYDRRAKMGGWDEEAYVALLNSARLMERDEPFERTLSRYREAVNLIPRRAEARHGAMRLCRKAECWHEAYALRGSTRQPDGLFIETWIYQYGLADELSLAAYHTGHYVESYIAAKRVAQHAPDEETRNRAKVNAAFAIKEIARDVTGNRPLNVGYGP